MFVKLLIAAAMLGLGWVAIVVYFRLQGRAERTKRVLKRQSAVPIAALCDGRPAKVTGKLSYAHEPLRAPLTGRPCAVWEVEVEEITADDETIAPVWQPIIVEQDARDFYVEDNDGRVLVRTELIRVTAVKDARFWSGPLRDATPPLTAYLERHGERSTGNFGLNRTIRFREGIFEQGELVTVLGVPRRDAQPEAPQTYRAQNVQTVMYGLADGFVVASDEPGTLR